MTEKLFMRAYFYSFTPTGVDAIDQILSKVAQAGKAYHHTEFWSDPRPDFDDPRSYIDQIQDAANQAAIKTKEG